MAVTQEDLTGQIEWTGKDSPIKLEDILAMKRAVGHALGHPIPRGLVVVGKDVQRKLGLREPGFIIDQNNRARDYRGRFLAVKWED